MAVWGALTSHQQTAEDQSELNIWLGPEQTMGPGLKERLDDGTKMRLGQTQKKRLDVIASTQHSIAKFVFPEFIPKPSQS